MQFIWSPYAHPHLHTDYHVVLSVGLNSPYMINIIVCVPADFKRANRHGDAMTSFPQYVTSSDARPDVTWREKVMMHVGLHHFKGSI